MSNKYRTHNCNELRKEHVKKNVVLSGWINKKRDHGNLLFIDLRDNYGISQCVIDKNNKHFIKLEKVQVETVIKITGKVFILLKNKRWKACSLPPSKLWKKLSNRSHLWMRFSFARAQDQPLVFG